MQPLDLRRSRRRGRALGIALLALVALAAAAAFFLNARAAARRSIHVVNGAAAPVSVAVDALPVVEIPPGGRAELEVGEGRHHAKTSGAVTSEADFEIEGSFPARFSDAHLYVLNPGGAAILVRETTSYSGSLLETRAAPRLEVSYGASFAVFEPVDYAFEPFPEHIEGASDRGSIQRSRLSVYEGDPAQLVARLADAKRAPDALGLAEWALENGRGERGATLAAYVRAARDSGAVERAKAWFAPRLDGEPIDVELHRNYLTLATDEAEQKELVAEYDARVSEHPRDVDLLYLRGRLEPTCNAAEIWFERAASIDPSHAFAQFSLACVRAARGRWSVAVDPCRAACATPGGARYGGFLDLALLSSGRFDELEAELRARIAQAPTDLQSWVMLGALLVTSKRSDEARALPDDFQRTLTEGLGVPPEQAEPAVTALRVEVLDACGDAEGALALATDPVRRGGLLLELERLDEAEELLGFGKEPSVRLALAVARGIAGDAAAAARWRESAVEALNEGDASMRILATALAEPSGSSLERALDAFTRPDLKAVALAALADLHESRAGELRRKALELQVLPGFPRRLLERAASKP